MLLTNSFSCSSPSKREETAAPVCHTIPYFMQNYIWGYSYVTSTEIASLAMISHVSILSVTISVMTKIQSIGKSEWVSRLTTLKRFTIVEKVGQFNLWESRIWEWTLSQNLPRVTLVVAHPWGCTRVAVEWLSPSLTTATRALLTAQKQPRFSNVQFSSSRSKLVSAFVRFAFIRGARFIVVHVSIVSCTDCDMKYLVFWTMWVLNIIFH